jgi:Holliday junction resolvase RusA-like endonuclease
MKIAIYGSTPSKKNSKIMVCRGKFPMLLPSKNYTEWHKDALLQLKDKKPITSKDITLTFFAGDNRKFDLTNKSESIMDTLVDAGLLADDNYTEVSKLTLVFGGVDKGKARCEIDY